MPGRYGSEVRKYAFGFNGMRMDNELYAQEGNSYTTFFRQLDPRIGRWMAVDPKEHDVRLIGLSPYHFGFNDPVKYSDDEGDIPWDEVMKFVRVSSQQGWRIHPIRGGKKYHGGMD